MPAGGSSVKAGGAWVEIGGRDVALGRTLDAARGKLNTFAAGAQRIGRQFLGLGLKLGAPFAGGLKLAGDFSDQMAMVATMLSGKDMKLLPGMGKEVKRLSEEYGEGTATITRGLYDLLSAQIPANDAMVILETTMKAAIGGMTDTAVAADALTTIINSYQLAGKDAADVSDLLFATINRGKTTFAELGPQIGRVASFAYGSGLSLEEFGAALATVTRNTGQTDLATTGLRAIMSTFRNPTSEGAEIAKQFGFELNTVTLRSEGLLGVLQKLQRRGISPEQLSKIFPNVRAIAAISPMLEDLAGFTEDIQIMTNRAGMAQEAYAKMSKTLGRELKRLWQSVKLTFLEIGIAVGTAATGGLKRIRAFLSSARKWIQNNQQVVVGIGKIALTLIKVGAILLVVAKAAALLAFIMSPMGVFAVILLGVALILEAFGVIDTGIGDLVGGFRIGGKKISTWMAITFILIKDTWEDAKGAVLNSIDRLIYGFIVAKENIYQSWLWVGKQMRSIIVDSLVFILDKINWWIGKINVLAEKLGLEGFGEIDLSKFDKAASYYAGRMKESDKRVAAARLNMEDKIFDRAEKRDEERLAADKKLRDAFAEDADEDAKKAAADKAAEAAFGKGKVPEIVAEVVSGAGGMGVPASAGVMGGIAGTFSGAIAGQMTDPARVGEAQLATQKEMSSTLDKIEKNTRSGAAFS